MTQKNSPNFTDQYQARFTHNGVQNTMKSESLDELQIQVRKQLGDNKTLRFSSSENDHAQLIYLDEQPVGSIAVCPVPTWATVTSQNQQRIQAQRAA